MSIPLMSRFIQDVRTRFESSDPDLLRVIAKVRAVKAMVEAEERKAASRQLESDAKESKTDSVAEDTEFSPG